MPPAGRRNLLFVPASLLALAAALIGPSACEVSHVPPQPAKPGKIVMGYYPSWKSSELRPSEISFAYLTHIAHAFAWPDPSGDLVVPPGLLDPALNAAAHAAGVKIVISLGGWGNCAGFPGMSSSAASRARFIGQLIDFCLTHGYDGADLDWEFVSNETEKSDFTRLVEELSAAFKARTPPLLLAMAAPSGNYYGRWIEFERLAEAFDFIGFMTYDYHGPWSDHSGHNAPLYPSGGDGCGSVDQTFAYALGRGVPAAKLLIGLPFFGRSFDCGALGVPFSTSDSWDYADIADLPSSAWTRIWDGAAGVPYLRRNDGTKVLSYDDPSSISLKCQYVKDQGSGGVIIWEISEDRRAGRSELLEVVGRSFGAR